MAVNLMQYVSKARVRAMIERQPNYPGSVFERLGFWRGIEITVWMICHPYRNTRLTADTVKQRLVARLDDLQADGEGVLVSLSRQLHEAREARDRAIAAANADLMRRREAEAAALLMRSVIDTALAFHAIIAGRDLAWDESKSQDAWGEFDCAVRELRLQRGEH